MLDENFIEHQDEQIIVGMLPEEAKKELIDCYFNKGNLNTFFEKMEEFATREKLDEIINLSNYNYDLGRSTNKSILFHIQNEIKENVQGIDLSYECVPEMVASYDKEYDFKEFDNPKKSKKRINELEELKKQLTQVSEIEAKTKK